MPTLSWNLLLYANAKDATEEAALAQHLADMTAALTTAECAISAQVNTRSGMTRHWITRAGRSKDLAAAVDTSTSHALRDFLDAATKQPARSTMLVLCGHGAGLDDVRALFRQQLRWIEKTIRLPPSRFPPVPHFPRFPRFPAGVPYRWGPNPVTGSFLSNPDLRKGITDSDLGRVDVLGLNACWMGMLEVMYELRHTASLLLSSQVFATRWPYGAIVRALSAKPSQSAEELATAVVACVRKELLVDRRKDAVAAVRGGAALDELAAAVDAYAAAVTPLVASAWDGVVTALVDETLRVDDPHQLDLGSLSSALGKHHPPAQAAAALVRGKLAAAVAAKAAHATRGPLQGLNLFCPIVRNIDLAAAYQNLDFRTNRWATFLTQWQATLPAYP